MSRPITLTTLRANLFRVIDEALATGTPVEVERNGRRLRIVPDKPVSKLSRLKKRPILRCKPDELLNLDWSKEWRGNDLP